MNRIKKIEILTIVCTITVLLRKIWKAGTSSFKSIFAQKKYRGVFKER